MNFCSYCQALLCRNVHLVKLCSIHPLLASGEKPKAFFSLTEFMPFKFVYNSNFDHIWVKKSNLVVQPIWQPYLWLCIVYPCYSSHLWYFHNNKVYLKSSFPKRDKRQIKKEMSLSCHFAVYWTYSLLHQCFMPNRYISLFKMYCKMQFFSKPL